MRCFELTLEQQLFLDELSENTYLENFERWVSLMEEDATHKNL